MNKTYRSIWNEALGAWVAVSEIENAKGKPAGSSLESVKPRITFGTFALRAVLAALLGVPGFYSPSAFADGTLNCTFGGAGTTAPSSAVHSIKCGHGTSASNAYSVAIGPNANAGAEKAVALGEGTVVQGKQSVAVGSQSQAAGEQSVALGNDTRATGKSSVAIGGDDLDAVATSNQTVITGYNTAHANATANNTELARKYFTLTGDYLVNFNEPSKRYIATKSEDGGVAVGVSATSAGLATSFGTRATASGVSSLALGVGSTAEKEGAVAIGAGSTTKNIAGEGITATALNAGKQPVGASETAAYYRLNLNGVDFDFKAGNSVSEGDIVSFGSPGFERQLKNVAPGKVSENSTDAINGSQLYTVVDALTALKGNVGTLETKQTRFYSIGQGLSSEGNYNNDGATGGKSLAAGIGASATHLKTTAVGTNAAATQDAALALGNDTAASGRAATAIGDHAKAAGNQAVAIGQHAQGNAQWDVSIGRSAGANPLSVASNGRNIAIGDGALKYGNAPSNNIAMGTDTGMGLTGNSNVMLGTYVNSAEAIKSAVDTGGLTENDIGVKEVTSTDPVSTNQVTVKAVASTSDSVAIGTRALTSGMGNVAVGQQAKAVGGTNVAVGNRSRSFGRNAISMGNNANAGSGGAIAIGQNANNYAEGSSGTTEYRTTGASSIAVGVNSGSSASSAVAIGTAARASVADGVALGSSSKADTAWGAVGTDPMAAAADKTGAAWKSTKGAVALGDVSTNVTRQITDLAAGTQDTDAVNVAQLKAAGFNITTAQAGGGVAENIAADKILNGETLTFDAGKNIKLTQAENKITVATKDALEVTSVQAGSNVLDGTAMNVGGQAYTNVAAAINALDAKAAPAGAGTHFYSVNNSTVTAGNYNNNGATGENALAAGVGVVASGSGSVAVGVNTSSTGLNSVAVGVSAKADNQGAVSIGQSANSAAAAGVNSVAVGVRTSSQAVHAVAIGTEATVSALTVSDGQVADRLGNKYDAKLVGAALTGQGSVAIGASSDAQGTNAVAIGQMAEALGQNTLAAGNDSHAIGKSSVAFGDGARTENDSALAAGYAAKATGANSAALGASSQATDAGAFAAGAGSRATAAGAVALGQNARADVAEGVALGTGSVASVDKGQVGADPLNAVDSKTGSAWTSTKAAVSVGNGATATRQITGLAAGTADTDAVNVAQLKAAGFKLAAAHAAGGESATVADDKIQNGETVTFDAGKNIKITHTANNIAVATKDNVEFTTVAAQDEQGNRTEINGSGITVTPAGGGNPVSLTSDGLNNGGKVISNVANGNVAQGSQEAVTGDQLYSLQQQLADSVGNAGKGLNFNGNSGNFNRKLGETVTVKGGLDNAVAASSANIRTAADSTGNIEILLADAPTFAGKVSAQGLDAGNQKITGVLKGDQPEDAVNVGQLQEAIRNANVTTQNVIHANSPVSYVNGAGEMLNRSVDGGVVKFTKASDGSDYTGSDISIAALNAANPQSTVPVALGNIKAGAKDTEAVNVSQLKNTVKALGGGAAVNPDGSVKAPVYSINTAAGGNQTFNNVGDALAALNADTVKPLTFSGDNDTVKVARKLGEELAVKGGAQGTLTEGNIGVVGSDSDNNLLIKLAEKVDLGENGSLKTGATTVNNSGVKVEAAGKQPVSLTSDGLNNGGNTIANVAAGKNGTDAVNVSQLTPLAQALGVNADPNSGLVSAPQFTVTKADGSKYDAVNTVQGALDNIGSEIQKPINFAGNSGNTAKKLGETFTVKGALADDAAASAQNLRTKVGSDGEMLIELAESPRFGNITVNDSGRISGVEAGEAEKDAVNKGQLDAVKAAADVKTKVHAGTGVAVENKGSEAEPNYEVALNQDTQNSLAKADSAVQSIKSADNNLTVGEKQADGSITLDFSDTPTFTEVTAGKTTVGSVVTDGASGKISGLEKGTVSADSKDAVNGSQLFNLAGNVKSVLGDAFNVDAAGTITAANIGGTGKNTVDEAVKAAFDQANAPLTFSGDNTAKDFARKLGTTVGIKGGADEANLSDNNIGVVSDGQGTLTVKLAKALNIDSVTAGNTVLNQDGVKVGGNVALTSDGLKAGDVNIGTNGIDAGNKVIGNVKAGEKADDAVNKGQLDAVQNVAAVKTKVHAGTGVAVENKGSESAPDYEVALNDASKQSLAKADSAVQSITSASPNLTVGEKKADGSIELNFSNTPEFAEVTAGKTTVGSVVTDGASGKISGLNNGTVAAGSKEAVNGGQLFAQGEGVKNIIGGNTVYNPDTGAFENADIGGTGKGNVNDAIAAVKATADAGWTLTAQGANGSKVAAGDTVDLRNADGNIKVAKADDADTVTFDLAKALNIDSVTAGNTVLNQDGVKVGDNVALTSDGLKAGDVNIGTNGIDAGNKVIGNVKAGEKDGDAVNVAQLKEAAAASANKVKAGSNIEVGETKNADGSTTYTVATTKDLTVDSVTAGNTLLNNAGVKVGDNVALTSDGLKAGDVNIGTNGIDAGNKVIGNVKAGEKDGDAVNVAQLKEAAAASANKVAAGENIEVEEKANGDGSTTYTVKTARNVGFDSVTSGSGENRVVLDSNGVSVGGNTYISHAGLNANNRKIANVAAGTIVAGSQDAVNGGQLFNTANSVANVFGGNAAVNPDGSVSMSNVGGTGAGNVNDAIQIAHRAAQAANQAAVVAKTTVTAGNNVVVEQSTNADGSSNYTVATAKDLTVDSVKAGDTVVNNAGVNVGGNVALTSDGLKAGNVTVNAAGINAAGNKITNVADGDINASSTDAVNGRQIYALLGGSGSAMNTTTAPATQSADGSTTPAGTVVTTVTNPDGTTTTTTETNQTVAVSTDKAGKQYTLKTYNVEGQNTYLTNDVVQAVGKMNEQGIKFFHTNDGEVKPVVQGHNNEDSSASGAYATAIGYQSAAAGTGAVAMGNTYTAADKADGAQVSEVKDAQGNVTGYEQRTLASGERSIAMGTGSQALAADSIAIGTGNVVTGKGSGAIGDPTVVTGDSSYSVGNNNTVSADNAYALGSNIKATLANSVYLGDNASATAVHTTAAGGNYTFAGANDANVAGVNDVVGVVSVGTEGQARQIQNVAAGVVSPTSTDAINGSQLHYTNQAINNVANYTVNMGNQLNQRIDDVENRSNAGAATAMAVAGLPQAYLPGKSMVAVAGGVYRGESGYALGYSSISDGGNWIIKGTASGNSRGHYGATAGVGYQW